MESVPVFVGLDYHSDSVQVCVLDGEGQVKVNCKKPSEVQDVLAVIAACGHPQRVAIEACCGAADFGDHLARATGWRVCLADARKVAAMRPTIDKTDKGDARALADLCRTGYLPEVWLPPENIRDLRTLVHRRQQLADSLKIERTRVKALLREKRLRPPAEVGTRWNRRLISWLKTARLQPLARTVLDQLLEEIERLNRCREVLDGHLEASAAKDPMIQRLMQHKGVGLITACALRAMAGRFDRFRNGKQFARYCGLTPRNASSGGKTADAGLVRTGCPMLKTLLFQLAHRVARFTQEWKGLLESLMARGKPKCVAIAAVTNRWTRKLWHDLKTWEAQQGEARAAIVAA